jgi:selenocysteine lyase/cysteine desulfurase
MTTEHPVTTAQFSVDAARARFSSLRSGFAFFDAPGGTQVPDEVGEAIAVALRDASGNLGAPYATGRAVEAILARAKDDAGRFLG